MMILHNHGPISILPGWFLNQNISKSQWEFSKGYKSTNYSDLKVRCGKINVTSTHMSQDS